MSGPMPERPQVRRQTARCARRARRRSGRRLRIRLQRPSACASPAPRTVHGCRRRRSCSLARIVPENEQFMPFARVSGAAVPTGAAPGCRTIPWSRTVKLWPPCARRSPLRTGPCCTSGGPSGTCPCRSFPGQGPPAPLPGRRGKGLRLSSPNATRLPERGLRPVAVQQLGEVAQRLAVQKIEHHVEEGRPAGVPQRSRAALPAAGKDSAGGRTHR